MKKFYLLFTLSLILFGFSKSNAQQLSIDELNAYRHASFDAQNSFLIGRGFEYKGAETSVGGNVIYTWVYDKGTDNAETVAIVHIRAKNDDKDVIMAKYYVTNVNQYYTLKKSLVNAGYVCNVAAFNSDPALDSYLSPSNSQVFIRVNDDKTFAFIAI